MALNAKTIKNRIKSVKNTKKITKAMEMVSAAKMRKAIESATATRHYAQYARELFEHLSHLNEPNEPLLEQREVKKALLVLITSNRGLCGSLNSSVLKRAGEQLKQFGSDVLVDVLGIGKKSSLFAKRNELELVSVYDELGERPQYEGVLPIAKQIIDGFLDGTYDKVEVIYTHFESALKQSPRSVQLLPMNKETLSSIEATLDEGEKDIEFPIEQYIFEPDLEDVIHYVIPRLIETALYHGVLESAASEHSARMVAMKNASEAAGDMIDNLNTVYNTARQAAITQEIAEIAGGAAALQETRDEGLVTRAIKNLVSPACRQARCP